MNVLTTFVRARRSLRVVAIATAVVFLNLLFALDVARLSSGAGFGVQGAWAQGAGTRRVAVFVLPAKDGDAQTAQVLNSIVRENVRQLGDVQLVTAVGTPGAELLPKIEQLADQGYSQLDRREVPQAVATFSQANDLLEKALPAVERRTHARVLKGLGVAKFLAGDAPAARDLVKRSLLIFPSQQAGEYDYSLEAKNLFRDARRELQDQATGTIEVTSLPPGAEVHVDHMLKGYTTAGDPLRLQNLQAGPHFVRVVKGGYEAWAGYVELEPAGTARVSSTLTLSPNGKRFEALRDDAMQAIRSGRGVEPALKELRRLLDASEILVVLASDSPEGFNLTGFFLPPEGEAIPVDETVVQDATLYQSLRDLTAMTLGGEYLAQDVLALDSPAGAATEVALSPMGAGAEDLVLDPDSPIFAGTRRVEDDPVYKQWWFWTIVGVAVGGATAGIVLLSTSQGTSGGGPTGGVTVNLNQF
jgi:hypothetical protein